MKWRLSTIILLFLLVFGFTSPVGANEVALKEKIGQMLLVGFEGKSLQQNDMIAQAILAQRVGGVLLYERNIKNPAQLKRLTQQLQDYTNQASINHANKLSPILIGIDYEGGKVNRLKEDVGFPSTLSAAEMGAGTMQQAQYYANQMAKTLQGVGVNLNFAPVIDLSADTELAIGKKGRSYSAHSAGVVRSAAIFSKAFQDHGILCTYKHFPGHGSSTGDTHEGFVDVTRTWMAEELEPYQQLLHQSYSCPLVMMAHVVHRGLDNEGNPASLSFVITKQLLRDKLHFDGVIITDDMQMKAITEHYRLSNAIRLAINAGADILMFGNQTASAPQDPQEIVEMIYQDVMSGRISVNRIDEAYQHIMKLKKQMKMEFYY